MPPTKAYEKSRYRAYLSEPITRCPKREKGRIRTLVQKITDALKVTPYDTSVYVPSLVTSPEKRAHMTPEHVYLLDRLRIVEADYVLVVADHTSFGIGGEVELATSLGKPVIFFSRAEKLSRFLIGTPVNINRVRFEGRHFIRYRDWRDLKASLLPLIEDVLNTLDRSEAMHIPHWDIGQRLKSLRLRRELSHEELADRAGLLPQQLRLWEMSLDEVRTEFDHYQSDQASEIGEIQLNFRQIEQLANPGLDALHRLCFTLDVGIAELVGETADQVPAQGPAKIAGAFQRQVRSARLESLALRAEQFDITFREFTELKRILIEEPQQLSYAGKTLNHLPEGEFLDALRSIRHGSFV